MKGKKIYQPIEWRTVCLAYELLHAKGYIAFPSTLQARRKVEALTENINRSYFGVEIYSTAEEKLVAILYFLIKDHPFIDGNKRTACLVFEVGCDMNGLEPKYEGFTLDELAVFTEQVNTDDHQHFIGDIARLLFAYTNSVA